MQNVSKEDRFKCKYKNLPKEEKGEIKEHQRKRYQQLSTKTSITK